MELQVNKDILLRNYTETDAAQLFATVNENRTHLRQWLQWVDATTTQEHSVAYIMAAKQEQHEQKSIAFGIFKANELIGGVSMHHWDHKVNKAQLGYWIAKKEQGKGLLTQSVKTLMQFCFHQLQINKLEVHHLKENIRSERVAHKLNFKLEAILRDSLLVNGTVQDVVIHGILRREFQ